MQGSDLKGIRKTLGMSQAEFGDALGLTSKFVGMMERGDAAIEKRTELAARYLALAISDGDVDGSPT